MYTVERASSRESLDQVAKSIGAQAAKSATRAAVGGEADEKLKVLSRKIFPKRELRQVK
jgi:hypothetical protein